MRPLFGSIVGVGVFGLPYAFAQAGYGIGLIELLAVGFFTLVALLLYADLVLVRKGHGRYLSVVGHDLGPLGRTLAAIAFFGSQFGTLLAYLIAGGSFAHAVFSPMLGGGAAVYVLAFWAVCSLLIFGGSSFVVKVQGFLLPMLIVLLGVLAVVLVPHVEVSNVLVLSPNRFTLPFGIALFAFGGIASIPEIRDLLGGNRKHIVTAIIVGVLFISLFYAVFTFLVVGASGANTTPQALDGLSAIAGPAVSVLGNLLGLFIVTGAFLTVGSTLMATFLFDVKLRTISAWAAAVILPFLLFLLGATSLVTVIGVTGGILAASIGIFLIIAYERARASHELSKNALTMPQWLVALSFLMYASMICLTVVQLVRA